MIFVQENASNKPPMVESEILKVGVLAGIQFKKIKSKRKDCAAVHENINGFGLSQEGLPRWH